MAVREIVFACCFCGETIEEVDGTGIAKTDWHTGEFVQQWWAHESCFLERLVPEAQPIDVSEVFDE